MTIIDSIIMVENIICRMAYDAPNGFRAEVREADGELKGVYGWTDPDGNLVTKTFLNDDKGFR